MTREELFIKLQEIFRDIFDDETLEINDATNSNDIDEWDSLNHINLIVAIERETKIKFSFEELATSFSVASSSKLNFILVSLSIATIRLI